MINQELILQELVVGLRNADILTITQRNVTTLTESGRLLASDTIILANVGVKNVRSLSLDGVPQTNILEFTVDYDVNNTCVITLPAPIDANYIVVYDYGTDKIFPGYPRSDLTISSYPRIAIEFIDIISETGGFGNVNLNRYDFTVVVYDINKQTLKGYVSNIRELVVQSQNSAYYSKMMKPTLIGPVITGSSDRFKDRIFSQNIDFKSILNLEVT